MRKRTRSDNTDHVLRSREQIENPTGINLPMKAKHASLSQEQTTTNQMEKCKVCERSFMTKRGLNIHLTKSGCRAIMEGRRCKSTKDSPQEKHHSGTIKHHFPDEPSSQSEASRDEERKSATSKSSWSKEDVTMNNELSKQKKKTIPETVKEQGMTDEVFVSDKDEESQIASVSMKKVLTRGKVYFARRKMSERKKVVGVVASKVKHAAQDDVKMGHFDLQERSNQQKESENQTDKYLSNDMTPTRSVQDQAKVIIIEDSPEQTFRTEAKSEIEGDVKKREDISDNSILHTTNKPSSCKDRGADKKLVNGKSQIKGNQDIRRWFKSTDDPTENTKDEYKKLLKNLNSGPPDDVISEYKYRILRRDYRSLTGHNFLNDRIIDAYLDLIKERNVKEKMSKIYPLECYMFTKLERNFKESFEQLFRWIKTDLTDYDIILVPIHKNSHWTLISCVVKERKLYYYDSVVGSRGCSNAPRIMRKFMEEYFQRRDKPGAFTTKIVEEAPTQGNGYDCGVFVCKNAEKIARGVMVNTSQDEINKARKSMIFEIFSGLLTTDTNPQITNLTEKTTPKKTKENSKSTRKKTKDPQVNNQTRHNIKESCETTRKSRIKWPKANSPEWERLDEDLTLLLKTIYSPPEKKAITYPKIIYGMCKERFGVVEESKARKEIGPSRRQRKCHKLREEINVLKKAYKEAPDEEKVAIQELNREKLQHLRLLKRAESIKNHKKQFSTNCHQFLSQPYTFSRNLLAPKPRGSLESSKEEVEDHLKKAHSTKKEFKEENLLTLREFDEPEVKFDDSQPSFRQFCNKLRKTRSKSAPGPNGVPYLVYKRCPGVARHLWQYLRDLWVRNKISDAWREAEGVFIPKEDGAKDVAKFRTISLLNVEGKLFFSLKADRMTSFLMKNMYINPSIQKGGVPGVSGCLEHTAVLSQLITEAKKEKKNLVVTWLDIANAYGSIPHSTIREALKRAHIPEKTRNLIDNYYDNVKIRFTTKKFTTEWQRVERGIITGCTLSVVIFALAMSWIVESVQNVTKGPKTSTGQRQVNSRLLMDDIATTTETVPQTRHLLNSLSGKLKKAGLDCKPAKCRVLVIIKGKVEKRDIILDGKVITAVQDLPVRYIGKHYDASLGEKEFIKKTEQNLIIDLRKIERCKIPGRYKCWILQHMLLLRLMWPLNIYNFPLSKIEEMQKKITSALKRWLRIPRSFSTDCLYSRSTKLRLPYSSLTEDFKAAKARNLVTFEQSRDPCIRNAGISVDAGRKANTPAEVKDAKSRLQMAEITGVANKGKEGLGMKRRQYFSTSNRKIQRDMVVQSVREKEEEQRVINITGLSQQGTNLRWDVPQRHMSHNKMINTTEASLSFLIKLVYDLLPTPANKNKWFGKEELCTLCGGQGTLNHILSGCHIALSQGRYKWRHDKVLRELSHSIEVRLKENRQSTAKPSNKSILFVREGEKTTQNNNELDCYLTSTKDWQMSVDIGKSLKIPTEITFTNLRPDITLISNQSKQIGIVELTVPNEDRIEISGELKRQKYEQIAQDGKLNGWRVKIWAVEVGCRGFPATSLAYFLKDIGYKGKEKKEALEKIGQAAQYASHTLWKASHYKNWGASC